MAVKKCGECGKAFNAERDACPRCAKEPEPSRYQKEEPFKLRGLAGVGGLAVGAVLGGGAGWLSETYGRFELEPVLVGAVAGAIVIGGGIAALILFASKKAPSTDSVRRERATRARDEAGPRRKR